MVERYTLVIDWTLTSHLTDEVQEGVMVERYTLVIDWTLTSRHTDEVQERV